MDAELSRALEDLGQRIDAAREEAHAAREEAHAAREQASENRKETLALGRVVAILSEDYKTLNKLVSDLVGAQMEFARQLQALSERLGRLVQLQLESRTQETDRYAELESRVQRLERALEKLSSSEPH